MEKKTSGLVIATDHWLLSLVFLRSDQGPASSGTADAAEGRETTATTKQHTIERLVYSALF